MFILSPERARDLHHTVSLSLLVSAAPYCFLPLTQIDMPYGTIIVDMDNQTILKVNLEDLPDDQKALIEQAMEEFREKCLLSYSRTYDSVIQKTALLSILLHG